MRKLIFLFAAFVLASGVSLAQDAEKLVKTGRKAISKYQSDMTDQAALEEARTSAEQALAADESLSGAWQLQGDVYAAEVAAAAEKISTAAAEFTAAQLTDPAATMPVMAEVSVPNEAAEKAVDAYKTAFDKADKSRYKSEAMNGVRDVVNNLQVLGNHMLNTKRYAEAYVPYNMLLVVDDFMRTAEEEPLFPADSSLNQHKYLVAAVAQQAGDAETANRLYDELYQAGYDDPAVYANYANALFADGKKEEGLAVLTKGRETYPDNSDILFAEINYYIAEGDNATLETKLKEAIAREPDNVSLYTVLGNVYMQIAAAEEDPAKADEYGEQSIQYLNEALSREPENVDVIYAIGSYYYNKAASLIGEQNALGTSKAEQAQYDAMGTEIDELFVKALPYFTDAEKLDPDDRNTLIALKEIYAKQNDFEKSNEYKTRLEGME